MKQLNQRRVFLRKQGYFWRSCSYVLESWQKVPLSPSGLSYPVSGLMSPYYFLSSSVPLITLPLPFLLLRPSPFSPSPAPICGRKASLIAPEFACYTVCMTEVQLYQRLNLPSLLPSFGFPMGRIWPHQLGTHPTLTRGTSFKIETCGLRRLTL